MFCALCTMCLREWLAATESALGATDSPAVLSALVVADARGAADRRGDGRAAELLTVRAELDVPGDREIPMSGKAWRCTGRLGSPLFHSNDQAGLIPDESPKPGTGRAA